MVGCWTSEGEILENENVLTIIVFNMLCCEHPVEAKSWLRA